MSLNQICYDSLLPIPRHEKLEMITTFGPGSSCFVDHGYLACNLSYEEACAAQEYYAKWYGKFYQPLKSVIFDLLSAKDRLFDLLSVIKETHHEAVLDSSSWVLSQKAMTAFLAFNRDQELL